MKLSTPLQLRPMSDVPLGHLIVFTRSGAARVGIGIVGSAPEVAGKASHVAIIYRDDQQPSCEVRTLLSTPVIDLGREYVVEPDFKELRIDTTTDDLIRNRVAFVLIVNQAKLALPMASANLNIVLLDLASGHFEVPGGDRAAIFQSFRIGIPMSEGRVHWLLGNP